MPDQQNYAKIPFAQIVKHPQTWMMLVGISIAWFFIYQFAGVSSQVNQNCEAEKTALRQELVQERNKNNDLTMALLIKNGIINEIKKSTDSVAKEKFGNAAKKIVEK